MPHRAVRRKHRRKSLSIRLSTQANDDLLERNLKGETAAALGRRTGAEAWNGARKYSRGRPRGRGAAAGATVALAMASTAAFLVTRGARTLKLMVEPAQRARVPPKSCKNVPLQMGFYCLIISKF